MADLDYDLLLWKLPTSYTFEEALLLMNGIAPEGDNAEILSKQHQSRWPKNILPLFSFLKTGVLEGHIKGKILPEYEFDSDMGDYYEAEGTISISRSIVEGESLANLLKNKGVTDCFFNTENDSNVSYLNKLHPNYAPKLAAAVKAWLAITNEPKYQRLGTPKKNAEKWLSDNAKGLGILHAGEISKKAIEDIATIVNWKPLGGASKTPSSSKGIAQDEEKITIKKSWTFVLPDGTKKVHTGGAKMYLPSRIRELLQEVGFKNIHVYGGVNHEKLTAHMPRAIFICEK